MHIKKQKVLDMEKGDDAAQQSPLSSSHYSQENKFPIPLVENN